MNHACTCRLINFKSEVVNALPLHVCLRESMSDTCLDMEHGSFEFAPQINCSAKIYVDFSRETSIVGGFKRTEL